MKSLMSDKFINIENVIARNVNLPKNISDGINDKLAAQQEAQRMEYTLQKEEQEANRKRIEAQGIADFQKIGRRKELAISRMSMAVMARQAGDKSISFMRFALGSCTPTPRRFQEIEEMLLDRVPDEMLLWKAGRFLAERMLNITGRRLSAVYKEPAIQGLFVRLLYPLTL